MIFMESSLIYDIFLFTLLLFIVIVKCIYGHTNRQHLVKSFTNKLVRKCVLSNKLKIKLIKGGSISIMSWIMSLNQL